MRCTRASILGQPLSRIMLVQLLSRYLKDANSKLAQFLRAKEDEESLLEYKPPRKRAREDDQGPATVNPWTEEPDFRNPSGQVGRQRVIDGCASFHFEFLSVSKTIVPLYPDGAVIKWACPKQHISPAEYAEYIERDGDAQLRRVDTAGTETHGDSRPCFAGIVGDPAAPLPSGTVLAIYSNISDDPSVRDAYWRQVPDEESDIRSYTLECNFERSADWWEALNSHNEIDNDFRKHALSELERWRKACVKPDFDPAKYRQKPFTRKLESGLAILHQIEAVPGFDISSPPITFKVRGGRMQCRIVADLPSDLSQAGHVGILRDFCGHLGRIESGQDTARAETMIGMMFTGTIHAPDWNNDERNHHLHIVAHDRLAELIEGSLGIQFRFQPTKLKSTRDINLPERLRVTFSEFVNKHLHAEGIQLRYDPRSYGARRIDLAPTVHLGSYAYMLDSIGLFHPKGARNGIIVWGDREKAIHAELARVAEANRAAHDFLSFNYARASVLDPERPDVVALWTAIIARKAIVEDMLEERRQTLLFDHYEAKAKSRAERTLEACRMHLNHIRAGTANALISKRRTLLLSLSVKARAWISAVDSAVAADRDVVRLARERIETNDKDARELNTALFEFARAVEKAACAGNKPVELPAAVHEKLAGFASGLTGSEKVEPSSKPIELVAEEVPANSAMAEGEPAALEQGRPNLNSGSNAQDANLDPITSAAEHGSSQAVASSIENEAVRAFRPEQISDHERTRRGSQLAVDQTDEGTGPAVLANAAEASGLDGLLVANSGPATSENILPDLADRPGNTELMPRGIPAESYESAINEGAPGGAVASVHNAKELPALHDPMNPPHAPAESGELMQPASRVLADKLGPAEAAGNSAEPRSEVKTEPHYDRPRNTNEGREIPTEDVDKTREKTLKDVPASVDAASQKMSGSDVAAAPEGGQAGGTIETHSSEQTAAGGPGSKTHASTAETGQNWPDTRPNNCSQLPLDSGPTVNPEVAPATAPATPDPCIPAAEMGVGKVENADPLGAAELSPQLPLASTAITPTERQVSSSEQSWQDVFRHIKENALYISPRGDGYDVELLSEDQRKVLDQRPFEERTQVRLAKLYAVQETNYQAFMEWFDKHGGDDKLLDLEGRTAKLADGVDPVVKGLLHLCRNHPEFKGALGREYDKRENARLQVQEALRARQPRGR